MTNSKPGTGELLESHIAVANGGHAGQRAVKQEFIAAASLEQIDFDELMESIVRTSTTRLVALWES